MTATTPCHAAADSFFVIQDLAQVDAAEWNALTEGNPFVSHEYLLALQQSQCAVARTGWSPNHLIQKRNDRLVGALPLYLKSHSRGEYVFDWSWAQAFAEHGLQYYPKGLGAVPFTPVPGPRLLAATPADRVALCKHAIELADRNQLSSLHILFPSEVDLAALREAGYLIREGVQFHWSNENYGSFDDFLGSLNQKKRKNLKQDRQRVRQAGIEFNWLRGDQISDESIEFFYECYCQTYFEHGNAPYLNLLFFKTLKQWLPDRLLLVLARKSGQPVAAALNIVERNTLYGRYWGAKEFVSGLHFETCYVQAIEYCIRQGIRYFEGGAQGEHKLSRGMLPVKTYSAHWIRDRRFADAIADFLKRETQAIDGYVEELNEHSPFKANSPFKATPDRP